MIRVWTVALDAFSVLTADRLAWLDEAERDRAARFYTAALADRWRVAHIALRSILADVVGTHPAAIRMTRDARGKPQLLDHRHLWFNLSHSADLALVAVSETGEVGVDVEQVRPVPEMRGVAESHFAVEEQAALWGTSDSERLATFYRIWTRKEAYVKATGVGIGPALARFAVTAAPSDARLLYAHDTPDLAAWTLRIVPVPAEYFGVLCHAGAAQPIATAVWQAHSSRNP